jgi:hypothetical protein
MITIVTCLYDIRSREKKEDDAKEEPRGVLEYLELGKSMLSVDLPMDFYTDSEEVRDAVMEIRSDKAEKTRVVMLPFEETWFYKDVGAVTEAMTRFHIQNLNKKKDTPLYVILNNNKFDLLERTIGENPFGTEYFFWMDCGIQHCAKASTEDWIEIGKTWPDFVTRHPDHIHHLRIHTVTKESSVSWKDYFTFVYHHIAGSCFGGRNEKVLEYVEIFKTIWAEVLAEGWFQLDEAIMTIATERFPEKFRFWYGDYDGLITNFMESRRSLTLVFQTIQRYLDARRYEDSEIVLQTLDGVLPMDHPEFYRYLQQRICNDFYQWDGRYSTALAALFSEKETIRDLQTGWIKKQMGNIRHYRGENAATFMTTWCLEKENTEAMAGWRAFQSTKPIITAIAGETSTTKFSIGASSSKILTLFRSQFDKDTESVRQLYEKLETPSDPLVFVHMSSKDEDYAALCGYLDRNFPTLDYRILSILVNCTAPAHPRVFAFCLMTTYETNSEAKIQACASNFLQEILK